MGEGHYEYKKWQDLKTNLVELVSRRHQALIEGKIPIKFVAQGEKDAWRITGATVRLWWGEIIFGLEFIDTRAIRDLGHRGLYSQLKSITIDKQELGVEEFRVIRHKEWKQVEQESHKIAQMVQQLKQEHPDEVILIWPEIENAVYQALLETKALTDDLGMS